MPTRILDVVHLSSQSLTHSSLYNAQASAELAATYAALILADEGIEITVRISQVSHPYFSQLNRHMQADKILALTDAASVELEPIWATLLAKALEGKNVKDLLSNVGAGGGAPAVGAPAAAAAGGAAAVEAPKEEEKKEEAKEESDDDMVRAQIAFCSHHGVLILAHRASGCSTNLQFSFIMLFIYCIRHIHGFILYILRCIPHPTLCYALNSTSETHLDDCLS